MTPRIGRVWGGFDHRVDHSLMGRQPWRGQDVVWVYPPLEEAMVEAELQEVETYFSRHQNTVVQFIATMPIIDLCLMAERSPGSKVAKWW